jgi:hypothetical protein
MLVYIVYMYSEMGSLSVYSILLYVMSMPIPRPPRFFTFKTIFCAKKIHAINLHKIGNGSFGSNWQALDHRDARDKIPLPIFYVVHVLADCLSPL